MSERATHGDYLAFVMKSVGQHMVKDKRRSTDRDVSIGEMKFRIGIELLIRQFRQISVGLSAHFLLQEPRIGQTGTFPGVSVNVPQALKRVDPESFAVEDMNGLFTQRGEAETGQFLPIITCGDCGQVVQDKIEAGVGPAMEFSNAVKSEHVFSLQLHNRELQNSSILEPGCSPLDSSV
jgi:hypothetical protein